MDVSAYSCFELNKGNVFNLCNLRILFDLYLLQSADHDGKGPLMTPEGHVMTEKDKSWPDEKQEPMVRKNGDGVALLRFC